VDPSALRSRLRDDFRRQFRGDLFLTPHARGLYATDASLFQVDPLAAAAPRDEADVQFLLRYAHANTIPVIARGAGTGLAGESLGHGLVMDLSVHFRGIVNVGDDTVRVQPGVVLNRLNAELAKIGRRFAPDPASGASCTVGGMIATDASGGRAARHGFTRDHVRQLRVIWDDGTADEIHGRNVKAAGAREPRTAAILAGVSDLLAGNAELIAGCRPKTAFNRCGYRLEAAGGPDGPDLVQLLVGSEGTLGVVTEATLRTIPVAGGRAAVAFGFATFEAALHAARFARELWPAACEVLDRRLITLARTQSPAAAAVVPADTEAVLLVEFERDTPAAARDAVRALIDTLQDVHDLALFAVPATDPEAADELWAVRGAALPSLYAMGKGARPLAFVEDIGVAPDDVLEFVTRAKLVLKQFEATGTFLVHAATGQLHLRPLLDPDRPEDAAKLWPLAEELHGLAIEMGGTVSAQHGTGLARTPWVERQYGRLFPVFRELKRVFDPRGILNPGKIVGPDPHLPAWPLRSFAGSAATDSQPEAAGRGAPVTPLLLWKPEELERAVSACNGCGACRTEEPGSRMCPVFRVSHAEAASPRAKANLLRDLLARSPGEIGTADVRAVADLCVNCRMCGLECPGRADIPKLMLEAKAANHAAQGLRRSAWFLARFDGLAAVGSRFALTANFLLRRSAVRWGMEKVFGLARRRTLPAFAFRSFLRRARRRGLNRRPGDGPGVAYFVDTFANVFDPFLAEAVVTVLRYNDVPIHVPPRQRGSGAAALAQGDADVARERLVKNVRYLADCARAGDTIVCSEPTAALFLHLDAHNLLNDADVKLVADHTVELSAYLWSLHEQGRLKTDFQPLDVSVGHHVPCHVKALGQGVRGPDLLALIPGMRVNKIDVSCSGMAGTFGMNARNFPVSLEAGRPMLTEFARPKNLYGSSECSACRLQMQEGTGKRALHPVEYLALAYGLMPGVADRLRRPFGGRVCS
jgi:FAD/FMN-containing dehydrogenase/Fe-S oxidoreductase